MTSKEDKSESSNKKYDQFFDGMLEIAFAFFKITVAGLKSKFYRDRENLVLSGSFALLSWVLIYKRHHLKLVSLFPDFFHVPILRFLGHFNNYWVMTFATLFILLLATMIAGIGTYKMIMKYQKAIDHLNLKSGLGHRPVVVSVDSRDENRTKVLVKSTGLGEDRYKSKLDDLRASVGQRIESVNFLEKDNRFVEISMARKLLEEKVNYMDIIGNCKRPYSFVVGKSQRNVVTENLEDVPHYMIAGSTGGGKSMAFKGMILGLMESSKKIQFYLFDFKRVEFNEFQDLPNVKIIKDEENAARLLEALVQEMDKRYKMLEAKKLKKVDPVRDNLDRIVIGVDECADLLGKVGKDHPHFESISKARHSLSQLARKARASGIHIILATQKMDKMSLDTQIQENLEGRLSLRMNTIENSVRVLQNNMSYYLPSIPGRGVWKRGADYTEIQCPYLSDEILNERIEVMKDKFSEKVIVLVEPINNKKEAEEALNEYHEGKIVT